jgi:hypothetical protein
MWRRTQLGRPGTYSIDTFSHKTVVRKPHILDTLRFAQPPFTPTKRKIAMTRCFARFSTRTGTKSRTGVHRTPHAPGDDPADQFAIDIREVDGMAIR